MRFVTLLVALACYAFVLSVTAELDEKSLDLIPTPFGWRPRQCVHRNVGTGVTIRRARNVAGAEIGVEIVHTNGTIVFKPDIPVCVEWDKKMQQVLLARRNNTKVARIGPAPLDGWLDYAGYYPTSLVGSFDGFYTVPVSPKTDSSQVLFYFIGTENFAGGAVTILQPVLTWGNGINGWSYASWNCCPGGQQHESTPLTGFGSGATLYAGIDQSGSNWNIVSRWNGKQTVLTVADAGRDFNWIDATLETYSVSSCSEFATGPMTFYNMLLHLSNGQAETPSWTADTGATECNGQLDIISPSKITISHS